MRSQRIPQAEFAQGPALLGSVQTRTPQVGDVHCRVPSLASRINRRIPLHSASFALGRELPKVLPLNTQILPWIVVLALLAVVLPMATYFFLQPRKPKAKPLPTDWALSARPVFSADERRVYRLLRDALPHHVVLSKLPLVRFCQPTDSAEVRYWYDLLGNSHVSFAICSANGRVLAAIDLDTDRGASRRAMQIKQSVLAACRVRYLRCPVDHLPSAAEVQLLVPQSGSAPRGPQAAPTLRKPRDNVSGDVANRRAERTALWQDSAFFQDSFFAPDSRLDGFSSTEFGSLTSLTGRPVAGAASLGGSAGPARSDVAGRPKAGSIADEVPGDTSGEAANPSSATRH